MKHEDQQFTPGPWQKENGTILAGREVICLIHDAYGEDFPNLEANARLIAAAPELLEAAEIGETAILCALPHADRIRDILFPMLEKIRAVLAKIQGQPESAHP